MTSAVSATRAVFADPDTFDPAQLDHTFRVQATDHVALLLGPALDHDLRELAPGVNLFIQPVAPDGRAYRWPRLQLGLNHELVQRSSAQIRNAWKLRWRGQRKGQAPQGLLAGA